MSGARMEGVTLERAGFLLRQLYRYVVKKVGKLPVPLTIEAHNPDVLRGVAGAEMFFQRANRVPARLKLLASVKVATLIGCPF